MLRYTGLWAMHMSHWMLIESWFFVLGGTINGCVIHEIHIFEEWSKSVWCSLFEHLRKRKSRFYLELVQKKNLTSRSIFPSKPNRARACSWFIPAVNPVMPRFMFIDWASWNVGFENVKNSVLLFELCNVRIRTRCVSRPPDGRRTTHD